VSVRVYVEGGGSRNKALQVKCRNAFSEFFRKAGLGGRLPKVIPGGGRKQTYDDFCTALNDPKNDAFTMLLVDSEAPVAEGVGPWTHLRNRQDDGWNRPADATDEHAHLMVQCMEAWFLADLQTLSRVFGNGFRPSALPRRADIEQIPKRDLLRRLENAARDSRTRRGYKNGRDSFQLLEELDPEKVTAASPHAKRLVDVLKAKL
jgi:hypothetical protein